MPVVARRRLRTGAIDEVRPGIILESLIRDYADEEQWIIPSESSGTNCVSSALILAVVISKSQLCYSKNGLNYQRYALNGICGLGDVLWPNICTSATMFVTPLPPDHTMTHASPLGYGVVAKHFMMTLTHQPGLLSVKA